MNRIAVRRRSLLATLVVIIAVAAVLVAQRFRGGTAPDEVARRYLSGVQRGDTVALLWLMRPGHEQPDAIGERIFRYRGVTNERMEIAYRAHGVASYVKFVCVSVDGAPFDEVVLVQAADRWYLDGVLKTGSAYCQASKPVGPGAAAPSVLPSRVDQARSDATSRDDPERGAVRGAAGLLRLRPVRAVAAPCRHAKRHADRDAGARGHPHRAS